MPNMCSGGMPAEQNADTAQRSMQPPLSAFCPDTTFSVFTVCHSAGKTTISEQLDFYEFLLKVKKIKGLDIYIPLLSWKQEQQWFTMRSGVLTSNDTDGAAPRAYATD